MLSPRKSGPYMSESSELDSLATQPSDLQRLWRSMSSVRKGSS